MRFYELKIGNNITFSTEVPSLMQALMGGGGSPLNIEFEVVSYGNNYDTTCGVVRLYNISQDFFVQTQALIGERIILRAGWKDSNFTRKLGWSYITDTLILDMEISNTLADFSGTQPYLDIFYIPHTKKENKKRELAGGSAVNEEVVTQTQTFKTEINKGELVFDKVKDTLQKMVGGNLIVVSYGKAILNYVSQSAQTITITASLLEEYLRQLINNFNINNKIDPKYNRLQIYQGELSEQEIESLGAAVKLGRTELLAQPQIMGVGGHLSVVVRMRPDLHQDSLVSLEGNMPSVASLLTGGTLVSEVDTKKVFRRGVYRVLNVSHRGAYYSNNATDWATTLTLMPNKEGGVYTRS